jgi:hypothetical protein
LLDGAGCWPVRSEMAPPHRPSDFTTRSASALVPRICRLLDPLTMVLGAGSFSDQRSPMARRGRLGARQLARTLRGQDDWQQPTLHALGTCQVFVALVSPDYIESEFCGREWNAFTRRRAVRRRERASMPDESDISTCILPVVWTPVPRSRLPRAIASVQRFAPTDAQKGTRRVYDENGIYGLMAMHSPDYEVVVWRLATSLTCFML